MHKFIFNLIVSLNKISKRLGFLCLVFLSMVFSGNAQTVPSGFDLISYEGFDYASGSSILNANGGSGWTSSWGQSYQQRYLRTATTGFNYTGLSTQGLKAEFDPTCYGTCNDIASLKRAFPLQSEGVVYFQFISVFEASGGSGTPGIRLFNGTTSTGGIGASSGSFMAILDASLSNLSATTASLSAQNLVVVRIDYNLNKTEMWVNPNLSTFDYSNPTSPSASASGFSPSFERIDIYIRSGSIDEITVFSQKSAPTSISGTNVICAGDSTTLTSTGGSTGVNALDVWYAGACGGEAFSEGWDTQAYATSATTVNSTANGILNVTSTSGDPMIHMYGIGSFDPSVYKYINFRYRVVSGSAGSTEIFFTNSTNTVATGGFSRSTTLVSDNAWHIGTIDMSTHTSWTTGGNITGWRYDFATVAGATMDIDFIELGTTPIIGTGSSINVAPTVNTTYYVNRKGPNANTACASQLVTVNNITSFTPTSAKTGETVTIIGTNFTGASTVSFGGTAATSFTVVSPTRITAVVASGTSGSVSVTTNSCTATKTGFTYLSSNADLSALSISAGTLSPSFTSGTIAYSASVSNATTNITLTPTKLDANTTIQARVNGGGYTTVASGNASGSLALNAGSNTVDVKVTAQDGVSIKTYTITVTRGLAPVITNFNNVTKTYFDASYTITAPTSNSSGAFTYTSDNPAVATISGTSVTIVGAGTATITATQAADATYDSGNITSTLTVDAISVLTKNGEISTTNFNYLNKNGAIGSDFGVNKNGLAIQTKSYDLVTDGLVMHLDAGNAASYPGTGTTWMDLSGFGNNGTLINNPTYNSSNGGNIVFNGSNTYVNAPLTKTASGTFSVWAKSTNTGSNNMLFNAGNNNAGPDLFFSGGVLSWNTWDSSNNPFGSIPATSNDGNWHNYVVVNDAVSNTAKLYYDGVLYGTAVYRNASVSTSLYIGGTTSQYMWNGAIGNFQVHNRILTAAEVVQNFNNLKTRYGL